MLLECLCVSCEPGLLKAPDWRITAVRSGVETIGLCVESIHRHQGQPFFYLHAKHSLNLS